MSLAPFAPRPSPHAIDALRARIAIVLALLGIGAALLAYALAPGVRHAVSHAGRGAGDAVGHASR